MEPLAPPVIEPAAPPVVVPPGNSPNPDAIAVMNDGVTDRQSRRAVSVLVSLLTHLVVLLALAVFTLAAQIPRASVEIVLDLPTAPVDQVAELAFSTFESSGEAVGTASVQAMSAEHSGTDEFDAETAAPTVSLEVPDEFSAPDRTSSPLDEISGLNTNLDRIATARGERFGTGTEREVGSPEEVVDTMLGDTFERLAKGNLLLIWLVDASLSMKKDRERAAQRLGPLTDEIKSVAARYDRDFRTGVVAFGNGFMECQKPTKNLLGVARKIFHVPDDESGREFVLHAVQATIAAYRPNWRGPISIVIWTDESGDDLQGLEETVSLCRQHDVRVTVVGPSAVLGQEIGQQAWQIQRDVYWLPVCRGPEAAHRHRLLLLRWRRGSTDGIWDWDAVNSGFPAYGLFRLARETGGRYVIFDRPLDRGKIDAGRLKSYEPDYRSVREIESEFVRHPLRAAVVAATRETLAQPARAAPAMSYFQGWRSPEQFHIDLAPVAARELEWSQTMELIAERALSLLQAEGLDEAFAAEDSPRWRASYDLARGRAAAMRLRYREFTLNWREIVARISPRANSLVISEGDPSTGAWAEQLIAESRHHLDRCIREHSGTPWEQAAQAERNATKYGFLWRSSYVPPPPPAPCTGGSSPPVLPRL